MKDIDDELLEDIVNHIQKVLNSQLDYQRDAAKESVEALEYTAVNLGNILALDDYEPASTESPWEFEVYEMAQQHKTGDIDNTLALIAIYRTCQLCLQHQLNIAAIDDVFALINRKEGNDDYF